MYLVKKKKDLKIISYAFFKVILGNSLAVQWLGLRDFTAEGAGSISGQGTRIPEAVRCDQI